MILKTLISSLYVKTWVGHEALDFKPLIGKPERIKHALEQTASGGQDEALVP